MHEAIILTAPSTSNNLGQLLMISENATPERVYFNRTVADWFNFSNILDGGPRLDFSHSFMDLISSSPISSTINYYQKLKTKHDILT